MAKQTLIQAVHLAITGKDRGLARCLNYLEGCPQGGWGETTQAWGNITDELPHRSERMYTVNHFVDAVYCVDSADRWRRREDAEIRERAASIEANLAVSRKFSIHNLAGGDLREFKLTTDGDLPVAALRHARSIAKRTDFGPQFSGPGSEIAASRWNERLVCTAT